MSESYNILGRQDSVRDSGVRDDVESRRFLKVGSRDKNAPIRCMLEYAARQGLFPVSAPNGRWLRYQSRQEKTVEEVCDDE
jgi:hypothetical protein